MCEQNGLSDERISSLTKQQNLLVCEKLVKYLQGIDPIKFEHLIKYVLEVMGYENVTVTSPSKDKGVDLVAEIEVGIIRVREVFQVKRQQANVGRAVLDGLRGSMHRFRAVRATIITTGGFSKDAKQAAFEKGATPVTLIDVVCLVNYLVDLEIGVRHREIRLFAFDEQKLRGIERGHMKVPKRQKYNYRGHSSGLCKEY